MKAVLSGFPTRQQKASRLIVCPRDVSGFPSIPATPPPIDCVNSTAPAPSISKNEIALVIHPADSLSREPLRTASQPRKTGTKGEATSRITGQTPSKSFILFCGEKTTSLHRLTNCVVGRRVKPLIEH